MLETHHGPCVVETLWKSADAHATLPESLRQSMKQSGAVAGIVDSRRTYRRFYVPLRAILVRPQQKAGVFIRDLSKGGCCFYAPSQLFPKDSGWLILPGEQKIQVESARCRRIAQQCYECGVRFLRGDNESPRFLSQFAGDGI